MELLITETTHHTPTGGVRGYDTHETESRVASLVTGDRYAGVRTENGNDVPLGEGYKWGQFNNGKDMLNRGLLNNLYHKGGPAKIHSISSVLDIEARDVGELEEKRHRTMIISGPEAIKAFDLIDKVKEIKDTRSFYEAFFNAYLDEINNEEVDGEDEIPEIPFVSMAETMKGIIIPVNYQGPKGLFGWLGKKLYEVINEHITNNTRIYS